MHSIRSGKNKEHILTITRKGIISFWDLSNMKSTVFGSRMVPTCDKRIDLHDLLVKCIDFESFTHLRGSNTDYLDPYVNSASLNSIDPSLILLTVSGLCFQMDLNRETVTLLTKDSTETYSHSTYLNLNKEQVFVFKNV